MGVPKRRSSKSRKKLRRAHNALPKINVIECPNCLEPVLPHRMCPSCGQYKGRVVKEVEEE